MSQNHWCSSTEMPQTPYEVSHIVTIQTIFHVGHIGVHVGSEPVETEPTSEQIHSLWVLGYSREDYVRPDLLSVGVRL